MIAAGCMPDKVRALRGGAWNNDAGNARSAYRNQNQRDNDWNNYGFRLVLSSDASGWVRRTRHHPARLVGNAARPAKRKGPGGLVGRVVDAAGRTSPGCSVVTAQPAASNHVV